MIRLATRAPLFVAIVVMSCALASTGHAQSGGMGQQDTGGEGSGEGDAHDPPDDNRCDPPDPSPSTLVDRQGDPVRRPTLAHPDPYVIVQWYLGEATPQRADQDGGFSADASSLGGAASTVAADLLQAVGTVVVRRAKASAMEWARDRIAHWLDCADDDRFARTCALLENTSLVALADEPDTLLEALVVDVLNELVDDLSSEIELALVVDVIGEMVLSTEVENPAGMVQRLVSELNGAAFGAYAQGEDAVKNAMCEAEPTAAARTLSSVALMWCVAEANSKKDTDVGDCAIAERVSALSRWCEAGSAGADTRVRSTAVSYAVDLQSIVVSLETSHSPADRLGIVRRTVDVAFDLACDEVDWDEGCVDLIEIEDIDGDPTAVQKLSLVRAVVMPLLDQDYVGAISALIQVVDLMAPSANENRSRALAMLGHIVSIAGTYTSDPPDGMEADEAAAWRSEQRAEVVDAIAREFANRSGRGGRTVVSFGGSLRLVLGADLAWRRDDAYADPPRRRHSAIHQPLSLPIGIAIQHLPRGNETGLHVDLSPFDLGQWVSLEDEGGVGEFDLGDVLAPSVTVGPMWGRTTPVVLGLTGGWLPNYDGDGDADEKGAGFVGLTFGIFVPIIDMN